MSRLKLPRQLEVFTNSRFAVPVLLLVVTALAYGLSFWRLGFYWDDQPISWIRYQLGTAATTKYFSDSRPVWGLLYQLTGYLLPMQPAYWQLFAMFWRYACAVVLWLTLEMLFPRRRDLALLLTLLVLLYPGFNQQWVSYVYAHFFIVLFCLLFSWYLMLRRQTIPAVIFSALNLIMLEYFLLIELARPLIILQSISGESLSTRERLLKTLKIWLPYAGTIVFAILYRTFVYSHPGFGYSLTAELARDPGATLLHLAGQIFSSLWATAGAAWLQAFQLPDPNVNGTRTVVLYMIVLVVVAALLLMIRQRRGFDSIETDRRLNWWLLGSGVVLLGLGGVAFWTTNVPVSLGFPANRATLSFMFGAALFLAGLIEWLPGRFKYALAALVVIMSAGRQFLWSVDYVREWESQKNLFWQMTWRAPGLQPSTMILMNERLQYNADNSLSAALNWIYAPDKRSSQIDYVLFYPTNRLGGSLPSLEPDQPVRFDYWAGVFEGNTSQTVAMYYSPPACLHVLDPEIDPANRFILDDSLMREAAKLSSTMPILDEPSARLPDIYNPEPPHGWCYYFQKADLARQLGDWEQVARLGDQAFALDDYPNDATERFVFVEGYAHVGDWDKALKYSQEAHRVSPAYVDPLLCRLWTRIAASTPSGPEKDAALEEIMTKYTCMM